MVIDTWAARVGLTEERRGGEVPWPVVVGATLLVTSVAVVVPVLRVPTGTLVAVLGVAATAWRARRSEGEERTVWALLAIGGGLLVSGLLARVASASDGDAFPIPSPAEMLILPAFVCLVAAGLTGARLRRGGEHRPGDHVDALIVSGVAALVVWALVLAPTVDDSTLSAEQRGLELIYSVLNVGLIFTVVEGWLGPGRPSHAYRLLLAFALSLWVLDAVSTDALASSEPSELFLLVPIPAGLAMAAALEPSARWAFDGPDVDAPERHVLRLVSASLVLVLGPGLGAVLLVEGDRPGGGTAVAVGVLLSLLILGRMAALAQERRASGGHAEQLQWLRDANRLLRRVDAMAREADSSADVVATAGHVGGRVTTLLGASAVALLTADGPDRLWLPRLAQGVELEPVERAALLPQPLDRIARGGDRVLVLGQRDRSGQVVGPPLVASSRSGIYAPLRGREGVVGVIAVEHPQRDRWGLADRRLVAELADVLAVTVENARTLRRLRTRGALEHRHDAARDLHDQFGQVLTTLGLEVDRLLAAGGADEADLEKLRDGVSRASVEVRSALRALRAPEVADGFEAATADLLRRTGPVGPEVQVEVVAPGRRAAPEVERQMVGIFQEALTNARRHGSASRVDVRWEVGPDESARLEVVDDGVGFDPPVASTGTLGLVGMAERAELVDALLRVESAPGSGCRVVVVAPPWREREA